ncbi:MAG: GNAT family N-acetyltransferase [Marmoricola sp.]
MSVVIRMLTPDDRPALAAFPSRVSRESAIARFHGAITSLSDSVLDRFTDLEVARHEAVIAVDEEGIAGVARYVRDEGTTTAEVAVLVADAQQHHGLAHDLMRALIEAAGQAGITTLRAEIQPENLEARRFFAGLSRNSRERFADGLALVSFDLEQP